MDPDIANYGIRPAFSNKNYFDLEVDFDVAEGATLEALALAVNTYLADLGPSKPKIENVFGVPMCANVFISDLPGFPWEDYVGLTLYFTHAGELYFSTSTSSFSPSTTREQRDHFAHMLHKNGFQLVEITGVKDERAISSLDTPVKEWEIGANIMDAHITLRDLAEHRNALALASLFPRNRLFDPLAILQVIKLGGVENLIGKAESAVFEVKSSPYEMKPDKQWQCELAEDVARFANSEHGGLLVIGIQSKKIDGKDRLEKIAPIPRDGGRYARYHQVLDSRIHPPVRDLEIDSIAHGSGEIAFILIPPQPEAAKPFLVQGAYLDGKYQKGVISIVRRREEHSIPITAREIHAMLAAGRALLQRGSLPRQTGRSEE